MKIHNKKFLSIQLDLIFAGASIASTLLAALVAFWSQFGWMMWIAVLNAGVALWMVRDAYCKTVAIQEAFLADPHISGSNAIDSNEISIEDAVAHPNVTHISSKKE